MCSLSSRAQALIAPTPTGSITGKAFSNQYDEEKNPNGIVFMGIAENKLM